MNRRPNSALFAAQIQTPFSVQALTLVIVIAIWEFIGRTGILFDEYPQFFTDASGVPVTYALAQQPEPANRLTVGLRFIWAIPALLIALGVSIAGIVIGIISWFAILITGKMPKGNFGFLVKVQRYVVQSNAYVLLLTDTYPAWG